VPGRGGTGWVKGRREGKGRMEREEGRKREGGKGSKEAGRGYSPYQS